MIFIFIDNKMMIKNIFILLLYLSNFVKLQMKQIDEYKQPLPTFNGYPKKFRPIPL